MYLNRMGSNRKRIEIPIFSKENNFLAITVLFLLTKTKSCFFVKSLLLRAIYLTQQVA